MKMIAKTRKLSGVKSEGAKLKMNYPARASYVVDFDNGY